MDVVVKGGCDFLVHDMAAKVVMLWKVVAVINNLVCTHHFVPADPKLTTICNFEISACIISGKRLCKPKSRVAD